MEAVMAEDPRDWELETQAVRGGLTRTPYGEISEALFLNQSFAYESAQAADDRFAGNSPGFIYQRFGNPTTQVFEDRLALLEGAECCRATASGMSAVHVALTGLLRAGDHLVAGRALFGSCRWIISEWLPRFGVETTYVDATDLEAWKNAVRPNTKAFLIESPANPLLEVTAIGAVAEIAHAAGDKLELRVLRQTENATKVADVIASSGKVRQTIYCGRPDHPQAAIIANQMSGGGNVIAFDLGSREAAWRFLNALEIIDISNNLGDAKSMATHPCTTTHRSMPEAERLEIGLTEGWVRMSVGLEGAGDLSRDVSRALDAA